AAGNNQGVSVARGDYVLLLNNDVLVSDGWLEGLVESLERDEKIGMVGPITNSISGRQMVNGVPYTDENGFHDFAQKVRKTYNGRLTPRYRIAGFAVLMRKALYDEVGGLDESFGTGNYEDDDLCLKIREKGYAIMVDEHVFIHHYRSQTFIENKIDYRNSLSVNESMFRKKWPNVDYEELLEFHNSLVDENATLLTQGQQALDVGNIGEAIALYSKILNTNPIDEFALYGIGLASQMNGKTDEAIDAYKKTLKVNPSFFNAYYSLALVYESINHTDDAISTLKKAIELYNKDASVYNNLGVLYFKKNKRNDARICFEKALSIDVNYQEAQQNLKKVS
ncbi:partial Putative mycofactocin biosynthesis glycosyltransferase MftF, partial [Candidatus Brocadiaceae bacterium]